MRTIRQNRVDAWRIVFLLFICCMALIVLPRAGAKWTSIPANRSGQTSQSRRGDREAASPNAQHLIEMNVIEAMAPVPALLSAPTLTSPSNGATGTSTAPTFSWSSVSGANRYWLTVATSASTLPTDPSATSCSACIISGNTDATSYTAPNSFPYGYHTATLSPGTTYYWRVQGWNTNGTQGTYSSIFSFTTANAAAAPIISSLSPSSYPASSSSQTMTVNGNNFVSGATLTYRDPQGNVFAGRATSFISSSQLSHPFNNANDAGAWTVDVVNPDGQTSNVWTFSVTTTSAPTITGLSPSSYPASSNSQTMTVNGNNFVSGATLTYRDPQGNIFAGRSTSFVSSSQLTHPFNNSNDAGTWTVFVTNPDAQTSNVWTFSVTSSTNTLAKVFGVDVSSFGQQSIDWTQVKQASISAGGQSYPVTFAIIRASKGEADIAVNGNVNCEFRDPKFDARAPAASNAGMIVGAYHVAAVINPLGGTYSPVSEARFFVSVASNFIKPGNLRPALDIEDQTCGNPKDIGWSALSTWVDQWMTEVHRLTGVTPLIYCSEPYKSGLGPTLASKYDLWVANYTTRDPDSIPSVSPWTTSLLYQYTDSGSVSGIGTVDLDVFHGSLGDFQSQLIIPNSPTGLSPHLSISPTTGILGLTSFTETYSGFTPNRTITENVTYPNGGLTVYYVTADGNGNASVSFVLQSQSGNYSAFAIDDATGTRSNTVTYSVNAATLNPHISISPTSGSLGETNFTETYSGFTHNGSITENVTYPNGGLTAYHVTADANGNASASFVLQSQSGNYSSYAVDDVTGTRSNSISYTVSTSLRSSPGIYSVSPLNPVARAGDQDISVYGYDFRQNLTVTVGFPNGGSTSLSGSQIGNLTSNSFLMHVTLSIPGQWTIRVNNPDGGQSPMFSFSVVTATGVPQISRLDPTSPVASPNDQNVSVFGLNFEPALTVDVTFPNGQGGRLQGAGQIQNVTNTSFTMRITVSTVGPYSIRVNNPDGTQSALFPFNVATASSNTCSLQVNPLSQRDPAWNKPGQLYDSTGVTINDEGCAMTCIAMALTFAGRQTDPGSLNDFMKQHSDYTKGGYVKWGQTITDFSGGQLKFNVVPSSLSLTDLEKLLCGGHPVIVGVNLKSGVPRHFVLVTGKQGDQFTINDPYFPSRTTLGAYNNVFRARGYVTSSSASANFKDQSAAGGSLDSGSLHISVGHAAELLLIDPTGRRTGFDPVTGEVVEEISNSAYFKDYLNNDETTDENELTHSIVISQPVAGAYQLIVIGQESGTSEVNVTTVRADGTVQPVNSIEAVTQTGSSSIYQIQLALAPVVQLSSANYSVNEVSGITNVSVTRSGDTSGAVSISYATSNGTAKEGRDYIAAQGALNFAAGETTKTFPVLIIDNAFVDGARTVNLTLSNPSGATLTQSTAVLTINDNDTAVGANPVDQQRAFVQFHYYDFFGRYPDQSGWDFWTNTITGCGSDSACTEVKRINASGAFFLSIEFQQTGYLVYRIYKSAFGNITNAPVPIRFEEFLPDTQQIGNGVIVNQGNWQAQLEANKLAFTQAFVQRSRFLTDYPTSMTTPAFVDQLFSRAGVTPSTTDRNAAIAEFGGAANTTDTNARARVLRDVAENSTLNQQEFNRAFVLMQYFGYLRRNPYDAPETTRDYSGYNFWLGKLNQFNGNFVQAEMVKAFTSSTEYRQRFGP